MNTINNTSITVYTENNYHLCLTPLGETLHVNIFTRVTNGYGEIPTVLMKNICNLAESKEKAMEAYRAVVTDYPQRINEVIKNTHVNPNQISDGYHTFGELYEFRKMFNAALFNEWHSQDNKYQVHKSHCHFDGEICFGGGWFIVIAILPTGQISNHYEIKDWDLFKIPETDKALFPFDGHTGADVLERLKNL